MIEYCPCERCTQKRERKQTMPEQKPIHTSNCKCEECLMEARGRRLRIEALNELKSVVDENTDEIANALDVYAKEKEQREAQPRHKYDPFYALLDEIRKLHDSKGSDYEGQGKPYCNLRGPEEWGVPAWVYAMTRCEEKMKRLKTFAKGSTLQHEGARDSLLDIAVLSLIAVVLLEENEKPK